MIIFLYGFTFSFVGEESNMAVMEISLPSGYIMDDDTLPSLKLIKDVKRVETKNGGTGIDLYFDKVCICCLHLRIYNQLAEYIHR